MAYKLKKTLPWLIATVLFIALTPAIFTYAEAQRGYKAIGGELFFPLIPLMGWAICGMVQDTFKDVKQLFIESEDGEDD